jgi:hypothetical protein
LSEQAAHGHWRARQEETWHFARFGFRDEISR